MLKSKPQKRRETEQIGPTFESISRAHRIRRAGGPNAASDTAYRDDRTDYISNEVAIDYNAAFTGAIARMVSEFGGTPIPNFAPTN